MPPDDVVPFPRERPQEIHLHKAPLVRVLAQARWDELTQFKSGFDTRAASLGEILANDYPLATNTEEVQFEVGPQGVVQKPGGRIHQFTSTNDEWTVHFAPTFVTLTSAAYTTRDDFCSRFETVLQAVDSVTSIPRVIRIGYRYVNRIDQENGFDRLAELVRSDVLGGTRIPGLTDDVVVRHSITETLFATSRGNLLAKWAVLPVNAAMDPTIPPVLSPSWVLDLDAFFDGRVDFRPSVIADRARELSSLGYGFFRWAILPAFLESFEEQA